MIELRTTDITDMNILYTDRSGKYRLVEFTSDRNNLEVILFRGMGTSDETQTESILTRKCIGVVMVDGVEKRCEIQEDGTLVEIPPQRGRVKKFDSEASFREYFESLKVDESKPNDNGARTGWYRFPCYVPSIEGGLFKIMEFALRDNLGESVKDAEGIRAILREFKTDIVKHFKSLRN